jgi:hypothetical protein
MAYKGSAPTSDGSCSNGTLASGPLSTSVNVGGIWQEAQRALGSSGKKVTSKKQAIAIRLSEARKAGGKVPRKKSSSKKK